MKIYQFKYFYPLNKLILLFASLIKLLFGWMLMTAIAQAQPILNTSPLPSPTEQQLQKGRELLDKIIHILKDVTLSRPSEVFRLFGSDQVDLYPQGHKYRDLTIVLVTSYDKTVREKWREMGVNSISIKYPFDKVKNADHMFVTFLQEQFCVSYDDVRRLLWPLSTRVTNPVMGGGIATHPLLKPTPPPVHAYRSMQIDFEHIQKDYQISASFDFEYQTCARGLNIESSLKLNKESQK